MKKNIFLAVLFVMSCGSSALAQTSTSTFSVFSGGNSNFNYIQCYNTTVNDRVAFQKQVFNIDAAGNTHTCGLSVGGFSGATNLDIIQDGFKIRLKTTASYGSQGRISPIEYTAQSHTFNGPIVCNDELNVVEVNSKSIRTEDITVDMNNAADYVFDENYNLRSLSDVESFVKENKHLPGVPSAAEMAEKGMSVSQMSNLLLEKVEELTLHMIELEKENKMLRSRVDMLEK
ncbi:MAG: hypothetical protein J6T28_02035 [Paludibacteraceae bacterium]|nr:hypothetical protein [Paludibacteraceae bacterium]MBP5480518.1 hypothetical protein [Paludibacteraceae bacterium]